MHSHKVRGPYFWSIPFRKATQVAVYSVVIEQWELLLLDINRLTLSVSMSSQDGHEICFVGDEAFRELSQTDPEGDKLLDKVRT